MNRLPSAVLAASLLAGCGTAPEDIPMDYELSLENITFAEETFDDAVDYLQDEIGPIDPSMTILSDGEELTCKLNQDTVRTFTNQSLNAIYCPSNDTVVIPSNVLEAKYAIGEGDPDAAVLIYHELGHAVQDHVDPGIFDVESEYYEENPDEKINMEQQATCYAGDLMANLHPDYVDDATKTILNNATIEEFYGSPEELNQAFRQGVETGSC